MSQVNLLNLCVDKSRLMNSLRTLEKLADSKEGPLRIEYKKGTPYLGIRTWKTFFFEKLVLDDLDIPDIERNTAETIDSYVGTLVHAIKNQPKRPSASDPMQTQTTPDLGVFASNVFFKLQAKASGRNLGPRRPKTAWMTASMTQPGYRNEKVKSGTVEGYNGKIMVPKGLSMGIIPIWTVIADARFVCSRFITIDDNYGQCRYVSMDDKLKTKEPNTFDEKDYFRLYEYNFDQIKDFETSVAMQLVLDHSAGSSEANRNGAWRAADEFIKKRAAAQNPVSVLLCTNNLPKVGQKPNPTLPMTQSQWPPGTNSDSDSESDYIV